MWGALDEYIPSREPEISDEEIRAYIKEKSFINEYTCWGPNRWYKPTYEEAKIELVKLKKKK